MKGQYLNPKKPTKKPEGSILQRLDALEEFARGVKQTIEQDVIPTLAGVVKAVGAETVSQMVQELQIEAAEAPVRAAAQAFESAVKAGAVVEVDEIGMESDFVAITKFAADGSPVYPSMLYTNVATLIPEMREHVKVGTKVGYSFPHPLMKADDPKLQTLTVRTIYRPVEAPATEPSAPATDRTS